MGNDSFNYNVSTRGTVLIEVLLNCFSELFQLVPGFCHWQK